MVAAERYRRPAGELDRDLHLGHRQDAALVYTWKQALAAGAGKAAS
jgi:hypothetical protein